MNAGAALVIGLLFVAVVTWIIWPPERTHWDKLLLGTAVAALLAALALNLWGQS